MNTPLNPDRHNLRQDGHDAPRATLALTPLYQWLIVLNAVLGAVSLALGLAATARGH